MGDSRYQVHQSNSTAKNSGSSQQSAKMGFRQQCIVQKKTDCKFVVPDNPKASGAEPIYEIGALSSVDHYAALIDKAATATAVDARLIRAIMYMETTHGYYDAPLALLGINKSILPMNINVSYWGSTFGDRTALSKPENNIMAGAEILKRLIKNLPPDATVRQIATLYNNLNATAVNDYGARVEKIYETQPWKRKASQ